MIVEVLIIVEVLSMLLGVVGIFFDEFVFIVGDVVLLEEVELICVEI